MRANLEKQISDSVSLLNISQKRRILSFIESLIGHKNGETQKNPLLNFAGTILPADLTLMDDAIKDGCENVDEHEC